MCRSRRRLSLRHCGCRCHLMLPPLSCQQLPTTPGAQHSAPMSPLTSLAPHMRATPSSCNSCKRLSATRPPHIPCLQHNPSQSCLGSTLVVAPATRSAAQRLSSASTYLRPSHTTSRATLAGPVNQHHSCFTHKPNGNVAPPHPPSISPMGNESTPFSPPACGATAGHMRGLSCSHPTLLT